VTSYDSGLDLPETAQIAYINLDTFCESVQNINNELEAWLTFLIKTDIYSIMELVKKYPEFESIYREIAYFREDRKGMEETMGFFSKELYEMDKEMERYMVDELREEVQAEKQRADEAESKLAQYEALYGTLPTNVDR
jgi:hypothetical protein